MMWMLSFVAAICLSQQVIGSDLCTLCEDGSRLPDPSLTISFGATCRNLNIAAMADSPDSCVAWRATAGEYCGCHNPIASEGYCRVCGGATPLPNPGTVARDIETMTLLTCGQLEFDSHEQDNCAEIQARYAIQCCDNIPPTPSPMPSISGDDGTSAGAVPALVGSVFALLLFY